MKNKIILYPSLLIFILCCNSYVCSGQTTKELLIGKWNYTNPQDNALSVPNFEFHSDSSAKLIPPNDSVRIYKYFVKKNIIYLKNSKGENKQIHISKISRDTLKIDWAIYGTIKFDYYRVR